MSLKYTSVVRILDLDLPTWTKPRISQPCVNTLTLVLSVFSLSDARRFDLLDAVVLWDWIISLPREYIFVRRAAFMYAPFLLRISSHSLHTGLEDPLDAGQNGLPVLPVSICGI